MKFVSSALAALCSFALSATAANAQSVGALAIDRSRGFIYGFSHDYATRAEAEDRARKEVIDRGGDPAIVLVWAGNGCGAYRTLAEGEGDAYGWGVGRTHPEADAIAQREAMKYSGGKVASTFVWACNEKDSAPLATIYRDSNMRTVKLAGLEWSRDNLKVTRFRNGDPLHATKDFKSFATDQGPAYLCPNPDWCARNGLLYNGAALHDPRGLAPVGWHVPSVAEWQRLISALGGGIEAGRKLRKPGVWADWATPVNDPSGMDILPTGASFNDEWAKPERNYAPLWATDIDGEYLLFMRVSAYTDRDRAEAGGTRGPQDGLPIRLIRDAYSSDATGISQDEGSIPLAAPAAQAHSAPPAKGAPPSPAAVAVPETKPASAAQAAERAAQDLAREQAKAAAAEADRKSAAERAEANRQMADFAANQLRQNAESARKAAEAKAAYDAATAERERIIRENEAAAAERERVIRQNDDNYKAQVAEWQRRVAACKAGDTSACGQN